MEIITILLIACGMLVGLAIGANNAANCLGTSVGAGVINYKKAVYLIAILALVGAGLQGNYTMSTVGNGIVAPSFLSDISIIAILFAAGILVLLFTFLGLPVSTTWAVIGGVAGIGILTTVAITWKNVIIIFAAGFLTPVIAAIFSYATYRFFHIINFKKRFLRFEKLIKWFVIISGGFLAYSLGANNVGPSMGLVVGRGVIGPIAGGFVGGFALSIGAAAFSKRVMNTIGKNIIHLDAIMAFTSQLGAAIAIYILTILAIPTSTTFAIIGGIAGTGLVKGIATVDRRTLGKIVSGWILTPILGAFAAILMFKLLSIWT